MQDTWSRAMLANLDCLFEGGQGTGFKESHEVGSDSADASFEDGRDSR